MLYTKYTNSSLTSFVSCMITHPKRRTVGSIYLITSLTHTHRYLSICEINLISYWIFPCLMIIYSLLVCQFTSPLSCFLSIVFIYASYFFRFILDNVIPTIFYDHHYYYYYYHCNFVLLSDCFPSVCFRKSFILARTWIYFVGYPFCFYIFYCVTPTLMIVAILPEINSLFGKSNVSVWIMRSYF